MCHVKGIDRRGSGWDEGGFGGEFRWCWLKCVIWDRIEERLVR
jgi:hypothetical protein